MIRRNREHNDGCRQAFTLVEMLVSVALVLLMMTMFARVFQIATESIGTQQAISENDQKARTLSTVIRSDLAKRTFRNLTPFYPGELSSTSILTFSDRTGYFYVSNNNLESGMDDLLQFTMHIEQSRENPDQTPFYGRVDHLIDRTVPLAGQTLQNNPNQPEVDDGTMNVNFTGAAPAAQVCYFIRNGNLYRRVLLLREPVRSGGHTLDPQPTAGSGVNYFSGYSDNTDPVGTFDGNFAFPDYSTSPVSVGLTNDFHANFDYSAIQQTGLLDPSDPSSNVGVARFLGVGALSNDTTGGGAYSLGKPHYRWGFSRRRGLSREHFMSGGLFMGRFLHAETSAPNFNWPQQPAQTTSGAILWSDSDSEIDDGNPFEMVDGDGNQVAAFTPNGAGVVTTFAGATGRGGPRAVEDLLLPDVHEFKIEFWDERVQKYLPMGHSHVVNVGGTIYPGDFHFARRGPARAIGPGDLSIAGDSVAPNLDTALAGPNGLPGDPVTRVFDSWHSQMPLPQANHWAPFNPFVFTPPHLSSGGPTPNGIPLEAGNNGYYDVTRTDYQIGDVVFTFEDRNGPSWDPTTDPPTTPNGIFDFHTVTQDQYHQAIGFNRAYRCVDIVDKSGGPNPVSGALLGLPPSTPGERITDSDVQWEVIDNTRPLKSMQITVRFRNQKSGDMRNLTMVIPLTDER